MKTIQINPDDNVAVAIEALSAGTTVNIEGKNITLTMMFLLVISSCSPTSRQVRM